MNLTWYSQKKIYSVINSYILILFSFNLLLKIAFFVIENSLVSKQTFFSFAWWATIQVSKCPVSNHPSNIQPTFMTYRILISCHTQLGAVFLSVSIQICKTAPYTHCTGVGNPRKVPRWQWPPSVYFGPIFPCCSPVSMMRRDKLSST